MHAGLYATSRLPRGNEAHRCSRDLYSSIERIKIQPQRSVFRDSVVANYEKRGAGFCIIPPIDAAPRYLSDNSLSMKLVD